MIPTIWRAGSRNGNRNEPYDLKPIPTTRKWSQRSAVLDPDSRIQVNPTIWNLFPRFKIDPYESKSIPTIQNRIPRCENNCYDSKSIPTIQKWFLRSEIDSYDSKMISTIRNRLLRFENDSHDSKMIPTIRKRFPRFEIDSNNLQCSIKKQFSLHRASYDLRCHTARDRSRLISLKLAHAGRVRLVS